MQDADGFGNSPDLGGGAQPDLLERKFELILEIIVK
jgi:hypothetical protein